MRVKEGERGGGKRRGKEEGERGGGGKGGREGERGSRDKKRNDCGAGKRSGKEEGARGRGKEGKAKPLNFFDWGKQRQVAPSRLQCIFSAYFSDFKLATSRQVLFILVQLMIIICLKATSYKHYLFTNSC